MKLDAERVRVILKKILFLPLFVVLIFTVVSAIALFAVFARGVENTPIAYAVYPFCAYTLTVSCLACIKTIPTKYKLFKGKMYDNKYTNRYLTDKEFKLRMNLYCSLMFNLLYVAFNAVSAVIYNTAWFTIFAIYYGVMATMRFVLVRYARRNELGTNRISEFRRSRICACFLMVINSALSAAVLMMVNFGRGFTYKGMLIYVMAAYTFYITTVSIIDLVKYRKSYSPIVATSAVIRLAAALGSMLFLETAMFAQFGDPTDLLLQHLMIRITGFAIGGVVVAMAIYMIVYSTIQIKKAKKSNKTFSE